MTGDGPPRRWRLVRASTDAVPGSVRRLFMARQRRRRDAVVRRRRWAAAGTLGLLAAVAGWLLWGTSLVLSADRVEVRGVDVLTEAQVRTAASVSDGTPLLRVPTDEVAARVDALTPVAAVQVRRSWPDTVVVDVTERTAVAAVPRGDGHVLVDRAGVVFRHVERAPAGLPSVVVGSAEESEAAGTSPDEATSEVTDEAMDAALTVLTALTPELRDDLETLVVASPVDLRLELSSGWTVRWGDETDSEEKARVATALLGREGEVMDVSAPSVVSVR